MNRLHYMRRLLWIGLAASIITVIGGELPIGWVEYPAVPGDPTGMLGMLIGSGKLSLAQLACGVFFGGIGIPLQYYGFKALYILTDEGETTAPRRSFVWAPRPPQALAARCMCCARR